MSDQENQGNIIKLPIEVELKESYLTYAMSVIVSRALPDVRDGLKPVHRRILYAMSQIGMASDKPYKKSATIVGEVLGKYHPHGEAALYGALVRLAQDFSMRYPLVDGQGNYGSVDGDPPAAMRYTECRMAKIASEMILDIDKNTVDEQLNYDDSKYEPVVLPSALPNLLLNGSSGIAVGMATNIPPHNLEELIDGLCVLIDNPESTIQELMEHIKGPDFPTAGIICGTEGIQSAYHTGRGKVTIRARVEIEQRKSGLDDLVIYELPYQVNKSELLSKIAHLVKDKKIEGISEIRDESDRTGMRAVIELKRNANPNMILNQLYAHTQLQNVFGIIMLALSPEKQPRVMNLKEVLEAYIAHRKDVLVRKSVYELEKAGRRAHITEGLLRALDKIDFVIELIRGSRNVEIARQGLMSSLSLSEEQAQSILDMKLQRLTSLENENLQTEYAELKMKIENTKQLLADDSKQYSIIKEQLIAIKDKYHDERRTVISHSDGFIQNEDLIPVEDQVIVLTHHGYMNRMPLDAYRKQKRGGLGVAGSQMKEDDLIQDLFSSSTHDYVLFFSDKGCVFFVKVYELPFGDRTSRGRHIRMLLDLDSEEKIKTVLTVSDLKSNQLVVFTTKNGIVKRCRVSDFIHARARGIRAIRLDEGDILVSAILTDGESDLVLCTQSGRALRIKETSVRLMQRNARGVRGIRLSKDNQIIGVVKVDPNKTLLVVSEHGYGKRMNFDQMIVHHRATQGQIFMKVTRKTGRVVAVQDVLDKEQVILMTATGQGLKTSIADISKFGRNAGGVRLINLKESKDNTVVAISAVREEEVVVQDISENKQANS